MKRNSRNQNEVWASDSCPQLPRRVSKPCLCVLWAQPLAIVATLLLLSLKPPGDLGVPPIPHLDKLIHFLVYGLIATGFYRAASPTYSTAAATWLAILLTSFFGGLDEIWQSLHPGRTPEWGDWFADTAGAILAVYLYRYWPLYRAILEWPRHKRITPTGIPK